MSQEWNEYTIDFPNTFEIRKPVLEATLATARWNVSEDGRRLGLHIRREMFSKHEGDIIAFTLNPYDTAANIFHNKDRHISEALAKAMYTLFGPDGAQYKK
jgi:hypothetical protein